MSEVLLIESMTKVTVNPNLIIRVWREEESGDFESSQMEVREIILNHIGSGNPIFSFLSLAKDIISLIKRINAIEILDKNGNGCVVYVNWP